MNNHSTRMLDAISIQLLHSVPLDFRRLVWQEFYTSRQRGISLEVHSPWIDHPVDILCVTARDTHHHGRLLGGLVLKLCQSEAGDRFGMVGYVCVDPQFRYHGIGKELLRTTIRSARDEGCIGLMLWSQSPGTYFSSGFICDQREMLIRYPPIRMARPKHDICISQSVLHGQCQRGLPAFASSVSRYESPAASVLVMQTPAGPSVAEWIGEDTSVIELIGAIFQEPWWLNALAGDSILVRLENFGYHHMEMRPSALMVLPFDGIDPQRLGPVRVLDRI